MWRLGTWGNHRLRTPSTVRGLLPPPRTPSTVRGLLPPSADSFHRPRTPSTAHGLLPPPRAVPLPRRGRSWGIRRSKPAALPSIGYRGFAVAPMTLRALSRSLVYSPGDERARNARPYGGRTPSTAAAVPLPRRGRSWGFAGQSLRPCRRLDIGALRSPL